MFAVARVVQDKISTNHNEEKPTIQTQPIITAKPKEVKPRFLISDTKTLLENANQQENQNREKKKIKVRLSIIKDTSRDQASNIITPPFSTSRDADQNEKKFKKAKDVKMKQIRRREGNFHCGRWQQDEHQRFIEAILKYGNEWKQVQKHVGTRSSTQARSHAQKFFVKIKKSNLFDFNVDFSKNSIKSLHSLATNLTADEYINAIKALNCVAFERKQHSLRRKQRRDDVMSATDSFFNDGFSSTMNTNTINLNNCEELFDQVPIRKNLTFVTQSDFEPRQQNNYNIIINNNFNNYNYNFASNNEFSYLLKKRPRVSSYEGLFNKQEKELNNLYNNNVFNESDYINTFNCSFKNLKHDFEDVSGDLFGKELIYNNNNSMQEKATNSNTEDLFFNFLDSQFQN